MKDIINFIFYKLFNKHPLLWAVENNQKSLLRFFIFIGMDVNIVFDYKNTLLMVASAYGYKDIVKILIDAHVDVNDKDQQGFTALMIASQLGHLEIVEILLAQKDLEVDARTFAFGDTALTIAASRNYIAASRNYIAICQKLYERGADPDIRTISISSRELAYNSPEILAIFNKEPSYINRSESYAL